jgi:hypothetical protein
MSHLLLTLTNGIYALTIKKKEQEDLKKKKRVECKKHTFDFDFCFLVV